MDKNKKRSSFSLIAVISSLLFQMTADIMAPEANAARYGFSHPQSMIVTGEYIDGRSKQVYTDTGTYKDSYFIKNSTKVQGGLARLSMLASSTAYKKEYAEELIKNCGFRFHKYTRKKPTREKNDTVSYEIGVKTVDNIIIIAVWVKGTGSDHEWVSNWDLGKKATHSGFSKAEKTMHKEIRSYLKSQNIHLSNSGNIKMWITGHSRGAAIADLYSKRMNSIVGKANVYAYTFATPRVSTSARRSGYENIFNYLNPGDLITEVAPEKWGYERYGIDKTLPSVKKAAMKKTFRKISGDDYNGLNIKEKRSLLKAFTDYAGTDQRSYYQKKNGYSPSYFCKNGLGYILAGEPETGLLNCLNVCKANSRARVVFEKLAADIMSDNKTGYAHTQLTYLCWLKQMYNRK